MHTSNKDGWRYALLLIVLFAISSLATKAAIDYIAPLVTTEERIVVIFILCSLTLGMMLILAAFAIWVINAEARTISSRHIGEIVNAMDYMKDGVLALNTHGRIVALNPSARKLLGEVDCTKQSLADICPKIGQDDMRLLLKSNLRMKLNANIQKGTGGISSESDLNALVR